MFTYYTPNQLTVITLVIAQIKKADWLGIMQEPQLRQKVAGPGKWLVNPDESKNFAALLILHN